jgi:hypothetical protein
MMSHYLELSKALGAPSHFSTDQTEHLHIRSTEIPYRKANKRHYAKQIVRRLEMSEQIAERNEYFKWRQDHQFRKDLARVVYSDSESEHRGSDGAAEDNGQAEEEDPGTEGEISDEEEYDDKPEATHLFPKQPAYLNFHIARASRTFGTSDLYRQLQLYYLRASGGAAARRRVVGYELDPLPFVTVSLYKQLRVSVEAPPYNPRLKIVLTVKADPYGGEKIRGEVKPYHSVVLINEKWPEQTGGGIKSKCNYFRGNSIETHSLNISLSNRIPVCHCTSYPADPRPNGDWRASSGICRVVHTLRSPTTRVDRNVPSEKIVSKWRRGSRGVDRRRYSNSAPMPCHSGVWRKNGRRLEIVECFGASRGIFYQ